MADFPEQKMWQKVNLVFALVNIGSNAWVDSSLGNCQLFATGIWRTIPSPSFLSSQPIADRSEGTRHEEVTCIPDRCHIVDRLKWLWMLPRQIQASSYDRLFTVRTGLYSGLQCT